MTFISQTIRASSTPDIVIPDTPCDPSVTVGDWVIMVSGVAQKALADSLDNSNVIGLVESKNGSTSVNIRVLGVSAPIFVGLDESKEYYLSDSVAGTMAPQNLVPTASGSVIIKLGQPYSPQRFLVLKGIRMQRS